MLRALVIRQLAFSKLLVALPLAIALFLASPGVRAAPITSHILIDPIGENNGDFFGTAVAWVGDVNGDGYDDLLSGAFRYPEIQSHGRAYLYFGGPALDSVVDLVIPPPPGNVAWFGRATSVGISSMTSWATKLFGPSPTSG